MLHAENDNNKHPGKANALHKNKTVPQTGPSAISTPFGNQNPYKPK